MFLARHGQTEFNVRFSQTRIDPGIEDPPLTKRGIKQAEDLAQTLLDHNIKHVISSPYTRALQTAEKVCNLLKLPITVEPAVRERTAYICDVGTSASILERKWSSLDFSHLKETWWNRTEETIPKFHMRCGKFRQSIAQTENWANTIVITHWGVIRSLTGKRIGNGEHLLCNPLAPHPPLKTVWS
ncbi:MAG: histidine phosphatase family protein [Pseudomonadota bacterium]|nr:histidine phosphatase family protein [Pseudomonadota bacterium]